MPVGIDLPSPSDAVNWAANVVSSGRMAAGQTQAVTPGDKGLRNLGQGISMANTALNPYANTTKKALGAAVNRDRQSVTEMSKSAILDALITGGALGVGVGVQKGLNAVADSGLPARIGNTIRGEEVIVHGTGRPVVGNYLNPAKSPISPDVPTVSGWNTSHQPGNTTWIHNAVGEYAQKPWYKEGVQMPSERNVVIAKTKINSRIKAVTENNPAQIAATEPAKIVKVVKYGYKKEDVDAIAQAIKMAGGKQPSRAAKAEAAALAARKRAEMYDGGVA